MKKTMRFLSCLLIMAMLVTMMAVPAFAATGQITLLPPNGEDLSTKSYEIYRIFNATVSNDAIAYQWIPDGNNGYYFYDLFYGDGFTYQGETIDALIGSAPDKTADITAVTTWINEQHQIGKDAWVAEFGQKVYKYIKYKEASNNNLFAGIKKTTDDTTGVDKSAEKIQFSGLEYGYYLVYESTAAGSSENANNPVRSAILLTTVDNNVEATLKMIKTGIVKMVKRDNLYHKGLSAALGTSVTFFIQADIPNFQYYGANPVFKIVDEPDNGFTMPTVAYDSGGKVITNPYTVKCGTTSLAVNTDYTIKEEDGKVIFDFASSCIKKYPNQKITIEYVAKMNENAGVGGYDIDKDTAGNQDASDINTAYLIYTSDPYNSAITDTKSDHVHVYTFQLDIYKEASHNQTPLVGAEFKLRKTTAGTSPVWATVDNTTGKINGWVDNESQASIFTTSAVKENEIDYAKVCIPGVARGSYELHEVLPPAGYNKLTDPILFTIDGTVVENEGTLETLTVSTTNTNVRVYTADAASGVITLTVKNTTGQELPTTGGMGTTLFTIGGLILMAGAAALLMARKKTEN